MNYQPVCGSDGKIYTNACSAEAEGLTVAYEIESPDENLKPLSPCTITKPDMGTAVIDTDMSMPVSPDDPAMCPMNYQPVCGSDGKIYTNACSAEAEGLTVAYEIESPDENLKPLSACTVTKPDMGTSVIDTGIPVSPDDPAMCPMNYQPVCGSDGKIYTNACSAEAEGLTVAYEIESPDENLKPLSPCTITKPDMGTAVIDTDMSMPVSPDDPAMCPMNYQPVCGSDGKIYTNACSAEAEGLTVAYEIESPDENLKPLSPCTVTKPAAGDMGAAVVVTGAVEATIAAATAAPAAKPEADATTAAASAAATVAPPVKTQAASQATPAAAGNVSLPPSAMCLGAESPFLQCCPAVDPEDGLCTMLWCVESDDLTVRDNCTCDQVKTACVQVSPLAGMAPGLSEMCAAADECCVDGGTSNDDFDSCMATAKEGFEIPDFEGLFPGGLPDFDAMMTTVTGSTVAATVTDAITAATTATDMEEPDGTSGAMGVRAAGAAAYAVFGLAMASMIFA